ncbi:IQ motif and SEC7 domain-containing protein 3 [Osmerus eperlanus]|uniref:IQ motif and SEC7 domain-containing protein 3 n=1 Tax=Osmerus eperlanus TaxID=29151 RepID=UPI002E11E2D4
MRGQRNGSCSHSATSDYELSLDLKNKQIEMLEQKYGGHLTSRRAACKIQTAFRQYQLSKNFEKIRNSLLESRLPRRISLRKVRVQNAEGFSAERALAEGCNMAGIPLIRSPSLPATVGGSLTDLEDSFTEQVQSLAKSIDDALSNWSLKTMCSLQEGGAYQFSAESFSSAAVGGGEAGEASVLQGVAGDPSDLSRSASKLLMAFRDVTVQIDSQNFRVSSSVVESSASVSLGNCVQQGVGVNTVTSPSTAPDSSTLNSTSVPPPNDPPPPPVAAPPEPMDPPPAPQDPPPPPPEPEMEVDGQDADFPAPPPSEEELVEDDLQPPLTPLDKLAAPQCGPEVVVVLTEPGGLPLPPQPSEGAPSLGSPSAVPLEAKRSGSDTADNSSEQMSSSSASTEARSASEASSKETLQAMILSLPRYHCENPASCKSPTLSTDVMRKRLYRIGLNLFNVNPDKGLQFLISRGFIPDTPIGVAHFLLQRKGLSRQMIGEFLGNSKKPFNRDVLDCVVDEMDFSGMELDEALRKFQAHIRCPGRGPEGGELIEAFSQRYCMCNPDVVQQFHNPDTIFILAFAIILLNTDMYSPNIKPDRKMMLEDFIRKPSRVDDGADIPRDVVVGIYDRIQQRELRSNEDHVTYVTKVEQSIVGMKTVLSVPHRRLVCCSRLFEVTDVNKAQKQAAHQREVFLFNDLIVILKLCPKKKSTAAYTFCKAMGLLGMHFHLFENEYYPHGITILSPFGCDKKQVLNFCAQSAEELLKFLEDLKESIAEVSEMEQIRIESPRSPPSSSPTKCHRPAPRRPAGRPPHRPPPAGPPGWEDDQSLRITAPPPGDEITGFRDPCLHTTHHAQCSTFHLHVPPPRQSCTLVSIHNRHQTYQLSSSMPWSPGSAGPPNHQGELSHRPQLQPAAPTVADLLPETLIQCQQIVKVIVLDNSGHGRVEAFLSHTPTHHQHLHHQHLLQAVVSTPASSSEAGGAQNKEGPQPPLPPPPPPYNHPHQYIPPDPRLSLQRTHSDSRSMV